MKFTLPILAMAIVATAAPAEIMDRTTNPPPPACSNNGQKQVCCSGLLNCVVQVIGSQCNNAYCCQTNAPVGALINIALLNCLNL